MTLSQACFSPGKKIEAKLKSDLLMMYTENNCMLLQNSVAKMDSKNLIGFLSGW